VTEPLTQQNQDELHRDLIDRDEFISALRTALMQLDDLPALRQNALLTLLASGAGEATPSALQRTLLAQIDALREGTDAALKTAGVPAHDVLYYRYVEQLAQADLAFQLGVSVRQLRRYQNSAIERLADLLCRRYGLSLVDGPASQPEGTQKAEDDAAEIGLSSQNPAQDHLQGEVASLQRGDSAGACDLERELERALAEAHVLAERYAITVEHSLPAALPKISAPPTLMRQVLLTLLTALLPHVRSLRVDAHAQGGTIAVTLEGSSVAGEARQSELQRVVEATAQLLAHFGGSVQAHDFACPRIVLTVPAVAAQDAEVDHATLLVVDDNHDTRYLFRRYTAQTRYSLIDTEDVTEVIPLARRHRVDAIILDVMMPAADGWELLAQLRHHPATQNIPVIMCTILPQQDLAYHLGVAGFMQKPISRTAFLATLDRVLAARAKTPNP
jgi:CheY-like chemotaxis protein